MYRFLLGRRWLGLALAVLVLATLCVRLGFWQLSRLDQRLADNAVIEHNLDAEPVPVESLSAAGEPVRVTDQWRPVTATGTYDTDEQLLVRYQTSGDTRGVDVLVPLVADDGTAVLVDRGFLESPAGTPEAADVPAPPAGEVTVTGWLRQDSSASSEATAASGGTVRAVSSAALGEFLPYPTTGGWVQAREESPAADKPLVALEPPELDSGPHFFYAMQWWFFALLALGGYVYFAYDEAHPGRRAGRPRRGGSEDDGSPTPASAGARNGG